MLHVGLDIHSTRITICALDDRGQVVRRARVRTTEEMLATLRDPHRFKDAEAVGRDGDEGLSRVQSARRRTVLPVWATARRRRRRDHPSSQAEHEFSPRERLTLRFMGSMNACVCTGSGSSRRPECCEGLRLAGAAGGGGATCYWTGRAASGSS